MALTLPLNISLQRARHILYGDETGGGHSARATSLGRSRFPTDWSDQDIVDAVAQIAADVSSRTRPSRFGRTIREGVRCGLAIRVIVEADGQIVTEFPVGNLQGERDG